LEQAMHAAYSGQTSQATQAEWDEYYRQQAAYEAGQQAAAVPTQATEAAHAKEVPAVPLDVAYEQEQGW